MKNTALVILNVQNCQFIGKKSEKRAGKLIYNINRLINSYPFFYSTVVYSLDSHPPDHVSFKSQHVLLPNQNFTILEYNPTGKICKGKSLINQSRIKNCTCLKYRKFLQPLSSDHCLSGSQDSKLLSTLKIVDGAIYNYLGTDSDLDSFSAFFNRGYVRETSLDRILRGRNISTLVLVGVFAEKEIQESASDAIFLGYDVVVVKGATFYKNRKENIEGIKILKKLNITLARMSDFVPDDSPYLPPNILILLTISFACFLLFVLIFIIFFIFRKKKILNTPQIKFKYCE